MKLIILSGAGMSAESGIPTFRGDGGLWEGLSVTEVATPEAFKKNPERVIRFYNERHTSILAAQPNPGHLILAELEQYFDVQIITQNIDDLHERAGSTKTLHLHGEITKARSSLYPELLYPYPASGIKLGDVCEKGAQLRPHIVWFGENVSLMPEATALCEGADALLVIGTSLQVYPANLLVYEVPYACPILVIDPDAPPIESSKHQIQYFRTTASEGMKQVKEHLLKMHSGGQSHDQGL